MFLFAAARLHVQRIFAGEKLVTITNKKSNGVTAFFVQNLQSGRSHRHARSEADQLQLRQTAAGHLHRRAEIKVEAFTLTPANPGADATWSYTYYATWGNLSAKNDENYIYQLPFPSGESYPVSQGFHGAYSHTGGDSFAIDFKMDLGTHVHAPPAAASWSVRAMILRCGGPDKKFEWDANYILVKHDDGTYGHYVHLQKGGNRVKVGDVVKTRRLDRPLRQHRPHDWPAPALRRFQSGRRQIAPNLPGPLQRRRPHGPNVERRLLLPRAIGRVSPPVPRSVALLRPETFCRVG